MGNEPSQDPARSWTVDSSKPEVKTFMKEAHKACVEEYKKAEKRGDTLEELKFRGLATYTYPPEGGTDQGHAEQMRGKMRSLNNADPTNYTAARDLFKK